MQFTQNKKNLIYFIFIFIFFSVLNFYLSNISDLNRHWTANYDNELTLAYNALLFNSAIKQEFVDHSGYFTILFLSIFFKLLHLFDFLFTYKFSILNKSQNLDAELQKIIYFTRVYSFLCMSLLLTIMCFLFNYFCKNKIFSFILTLVILSSYGSIFHINQLRTEVFAMIFFLLSLINLILFFDRDSKKKIFNIIFFFLFLYCSILNKNQTFLYLPAILILSYFSYKKLDLKNFDLSNFLFLEKKISSYVLFAIIFLYLSLKYLSEYSNNVISPLFIILNIFLINIYFFICFRKSNIKIRPNLVTLNFILVITFFLLKSFLFIHPSTNELAFSHTFTNIGHSLVYIDEKLRSSNNFEFFSQITKFFLVFKLFMQELFIHLNFYSYLILLSLLLNFIYRNELQKNELFFNLACIIVFFYISSINLLRPKSDYLIFSDFFLILSFANLNKKTLNLKFVVISIFLIISIKFNFYKNLDYLKSKNTNQIKKLCNDTYFFDWHKKIEVNKFNDFCKKNNIYIK